MALNQVNAIILVGGPGQSALREIAGHPVSLLPVPGTEHFLYTWLRTLLKIDAVTKVDVLTGKADDLRMLTTATRNWDANHLGQTGVYADRENHRGTAGAIRDFMNSLKYKGDLLIIEGNRLPPSNPNLLFDVDYDREDVIGSLGRTSSYEPSGIMAVKNRILDLIPEIGFFDLKEQLIPRALERGERIIVREISGRSDRLSDGESYLRCIRTLGEKGLGSNGGGPWIADAAEVHSTAVIGTQSLVADNARIHHGAVIEDSVVLDGAVVGSGSLVVESVIGRDARIAPESKVIRGVAYGKNASLIKSGALA